MDLRVMVLCGFFLGLAGQTVKLCADTAMQIDVDDALRGHVFRGAGRAVLDGVHRGRHRGRRGDSCRQPFRGTGARRFGDLSAGSRPACRLAATGSL